VDAPLWAGLVAGVPLVALGVLVLATRVTLSASAWAVTIGTAILALTRFGLDPIPLLLAMGKGAWTGVWILLIVIPALLLYQVMDSSGALDVLSDALSTVAPTRGRLLLLVGWAFPSFLQGVAGFGVPVVVAAPMLVRAGIPPIIAVAACLVGYHWSVTFGSMGSSFFVAAGVAQLSPEATSAFALRASTLLALLCLVAGLILLLAWARDELRTALPRALAVGVVMGGTLVGVAALAPALASTAAGLAGLGAAALLLPARGSRPAWRRLLRTAAPYLALTAMVVIAFGVPPVRELASRVPAIAPAFPVTRAAFGHVNAAIPAHQPLRPLLHAGPYLLVATAIGAVLYRRLDSRGFAKRPRAVSRVLTPWAHRSFSTAVSLLGLTVLAGVMVDAGMIEAMAQALTRALGPAYVVIAPAVGAIGTIMTGSTTASNALLAPLQASAAARLGLPAPALLAAQTVGGNVGNVLTPVNALVAVMATGSDGEVGAVLRKAALPALLLLVVASAATAILTLP